MRHLPITLILAFSWPSFSPLPCFSQSSIAETLGQSPIDNEFLLIERSLTAGEFDVAMERFARLALPIDASSESAIGLWQGLSPVQKERVTQLTLGSIYKHEFSRFLSEKVAAAQGVFMTYERSRGLYYRQGYSEDAFVQTFGIRMMQEMKRLDLTSAYSTDRAVRRSANEYLALKNQYGISTDLTYTYVSDYFRKIRFEELASYYLGWLLRKKPYLNSYDGPGPVGAPIVIPLDEVLRFVADLPETKSSPVIRDLVVSIYADILGHDKSDRISGFHDNREITIRIAALTEGNKTRGFASWITALGVVLIGLVVSVSPLLHRKRRGRSSPID